MIPTRQDIVAVTRAPLEWDRKKTNGYLGRRIVTDVILSNNYKLEANDRLHPSVDLLDVNDFEAQDPPFKCQFWRLPPGVDPERARLHHYSALMGVEGVG